MACVCMFFFVVYVPNGNMKLEETSEGKILDIVFSLQSLGCVLGVRLAYLCSLIKRGQPPLRRHGQRAVAFNFEVGNTLPYYSTHIQSVMWCVRPT